MSTDLDVRLREANPVPVVEDTAALRATERSLVARIVGTPRQRARGGRVGPRRAARPRYVLAGAVLVAAIVVAVTLVGPGRPGTPTGPTVASASEVLRQTAASARIAPDYTLRGEQRVYSGYLATSGKYVVSGEWWVDADGDYVVRTRTYSKAATRAFGIPEGEGALERSQPWTKESVEPRRWTYDGLRALPTTAPALTRWIRAEVAKEQPDPNAPESATNPDARALAQAVDLLTQRLAPPALRAAALDVIAALPGSLRLGSGTDALGRSGERIGVRSRFDSSVQDTLLVQPATGAVLESATGVAVVSAPANAAPSYNGPTGSATVSASVRTYVGPVVVPRELVVPAGTTVAPRSTPSG